MVTERYTVGGMTCAHCAAAVTDEVAKIAGVSNVAVEVASGLVTVDRADTLDPARVGAAVDEAGYKLVDAAGRR